MRGNTPCSLPGQPAISLGRVAFVPRNPERRPRNNPGRDFFVCVVAWLAALPPPPLQSFHTGDTLEVGFFPAV